MVQQVKSSETMMQRWLKSWSFFSGFFNNRIMQQPPISRCSMGLEYLSIHWMAKKKYGKIWQIKVEYQARFLVHVGIVPRPLIWVPQGFLYTKTLFLKIKSEGN